jgi:hypothetical protein
MSTDAKALGRQVAREFPRDTDRYVVAEAARVRALELGHTAEFADWARSSALAVQAIGQVLTPISEEEAYARAARAITGMVKD